MPWSDNQFEPSFTKTHPRVVNGKREVNETVNETVYHKTRGAFIGKHEDFSKRWFLDTSKRRGGKNALFVYCVSTAPTPGHSFKPRGSEMTILVDSREPWPHPWSPFWPDVAVERGTLDTGDLCLGGNSTVVIERKTQGDLAACMTS